MAASKIPPMKESGVFQSIGGMIQDFFEIFKQASNSDVFVALASIVGVTITLEIIIKGFQVYAGKTQTPTQDLIWSISFKIILISIALDYTGYLQAIKDAMQEIHGIMSGHKDLWVAMDSRYNETLNFTNYLMYNEKNSWEIGAMGLTVKLVTPSASFAAILIWISFALGIVSTFFIVATGEITLRILMIFLPLILICKAYKFGDQMFTQWINAFVSNLLVVFIVGSLFDIFTKKFSAYVGLIETKLKNGEDFSNLVIGFDILLVGIVLCLILKIATNIAKELGSVSLEGDKMGSAISGAMAGGVASATSTAWRGAGAAMGASKNIIGAASTGGAGAAFKAAGGAARSATVGAAKMGASAFAKGK